MKDATRSPKGRSRCSSSIWRPIDRRLSRAEHRLLSLGCIVGAALAVAGCGETDPTAGASNVASERAALQSAVFVGAETCQSCHPEEGKLWQDSHHDLSMQEADGSTVLANFDDVTLEAAGQVTRFFRKEGAFFVNAEGADGVSRDFQVLYTFGVEPLQQYLVPTSQGKLQALTWAWDSRAAELGGQRWFSLVDDEAQDPEDALHWSGAAFNWNHSCGDCHSTGYTKAFDRSSGDFHTTWEHIDVSCEACHGPGSAHVEWANTVGGTVSTAYESVEEVGLVVDLGDRSNGQWEVSSTTGLAKRTVARSSRQQVEACGRCHARRLALEAQYEHGRPLLDTHEPVLIEDGLFHADGQILDEVYVYNSFLQSRMYEAGVTCSDCHDPHGLQIASSDAVCAKCHAPGVFAQPEHHLHEQQSSGARCVACHMPESTYMGVDRRGDHSFRIPSPKLSEEFGTPNACSGCHEGEAPGELSRKWHGLKLAAGQEVAAPDSVRWQRLLAKARSGGAGSAAAVSQLAADPSAPSVVRATAVALAAELAPSQAPRIVWQAAESSDPWLRFGAARSLEGLPMGQRESVGLRLATDSLRGVRIEAASALAEEALARGAGSASSEVGGLRPVVRAAIDELEESLRLHTDTAAALVSLGDLRRFEADAVNAEATYLEAVARQPDCGPCYVNLSDLYRVTGRDPEAANLLEDASKRLPESADILHALGLTLVRLGRLSEAVEPLRRAAELQPATVRYGFVYAMALEEAGERQAAIVVLRKMEEAFPEEPVVQQLLEAYTKQLSADSR